MKTVTKCSRYLDLALIVDGGLHIYIPLSSRLGSNVNLRGNGVAAQTAQLNLSGANGRQKASGLVDFWSSALK
jgi:hypothetical protein